MQSLMSGTVGKKYPDETKQLFGKAEKYCFEFINDMPDLGKNMIAKNMLDRFTILSFYEASDHCLNGESLLTIKRQMTTDRSSSTTVFAADASLC